LHNKLRKISYFLINFCTQLSCCLNWLTILSFHHNEQEQRRCIETRRKLKFQQKKPTNKFGTVFYFDNLFEFDMLENERKNKFWRLNLILIRSPKETSKIRFQLINYSPKKSQIITVLRKLFEPTELNKNLRHAIRESVSVNLLLENFSSRNRVVYTAPSSYVYTHCHNFPFGLFWHFITSHTHRSAIDIERNNQRKLLRKWIWSNGFCFFSIHITKSNSSWREKTFLQLKLSRHIVELVSNT
jgi:hypothetical protein